MSARSGMTPLIHKKRNFCCKACSRRASLVLFLFLVASSIFATKILSGTVIGRTRLWESRAFASSVLTLQLPLDFARFDGYSWQGLHDSQLSTISSAADFVALSLTSSVRAFCDCPLSSSWFQHQNVCVDGRNYVRYINNSEDEYTKQADELGLSRASEPLRPAELRWDAPDDGPNSEGVLPSDTQVQILGGHSIMLHCWRSPSHNPLHFLFGFGALYSAILDSPDRTPLDHVIFHQCPNPHINALFRTFWEVLLMEGYDQRIINDNTTFHVVSDLSRLVCMKNVTGNEWLQAPYFATFEREWLSWKRQLFRYLKHRHPELIESALMASDDRSTSTSSVRIAIFQRKEAGNGLRLYVNLPDVLSLVKNYTQRYSVITTSPETNLTTMITDFNSFDILITPHGSHIANALFTLREDVVIIETVGMLINDQSATWLQNRMTYLISTRHRSNEDAVQQVIEECGEIREAHFKGAQLPEKCGTEATQRVMSSDLIIDLEILKNDIDKSLQILYGQPDA